MSEQLALGLERAEKGTQRVIANNEEYSAKAQSWVRSLPKGYQIDALVLRKVVGDPPHPNLIGAIFRELAKNKIITKLGYRKSPRPERHAAEIRFYERTGVAPESVFDTQGTAL